MATDVNSEVEQLYVAYFNRPADSAGLAYWSGVLTTDPNGYQNMSANFAASAEYKAMYAGMSNADVVNAVYEHLFGRAAESAGDAYWANLLNNGQITVDNVVTQVAAGAQGSDEFAYQAKVAVATAFTARVATDNAQTAYSGDAANKLAYNYLSNVKDLTTAASGMDPGNMDATINQIVGTHTAASVHSIMHIA